jgi:hypothetical protein
MSVTTERPSFEVEHATIVAAERGHLPSSFTGILTEAILDRFALPGLTGCALTSANQCREGEAKRSAPGRRAARLVATGR